MSAELSKLPIKVSEIKIVSLFIDSATDAAIRSSPTLKSARLQGDGAALRSEADFDALFKRASGKMIVLLGHVEGTDYVVRTAKNDVQLSTPIARVREMARTHNVSLVDIGCETTKAIQSDAIGFSVMNKYSSIEAIRSLDGALRKSKNMEDFLVNTSSDGLRIVIDPTYAAEKINTKASIYARAKKGAERAWVKVAQVTATFMN